MITLIIYRSYVILHTLSSSSSVSSKLLEFASSTKSILFLKSIFTRCEINSRSYLSSYVSSTQEFWTLVNKSLIFDLSLTFLEVSTFLSTVCFSYMVFTLLKLLVYLVSIVSLSLSLDITSDGFATEIIELLSYFDCREYFSFLLSR